MSNYNSQLQSNNTDLQAILNTINELPSAGGSDPVLQDKTITPTTSKQTITADNGYDGLDTVTVNAMPTATQATPTITVNSSTGLITATATQNAGYVAAGTKSATMQLAFQAAQTITPGTTNKTIAANTYLGGVQTIKGDANLVADNIKKDTSIFGVTGTYEGNGGSGGGDGDFVAEQFLMRTIVSCTNNQISRIGNYAFGGCGLLTTVDFQNCTTIGQSAFIGCSSLNVINFPICSWIGSGAFERCTGLKSAYFSKCTVINARAFSNCNALVSASFPVCNWIHGSAFYYCNTLKYISFPKCVSIFDGAFKYCYTLSECAFPACSIIGSSAFQYCSKLFSIDLPVCTTIGIEAFGQCSTLSVINLPMCTSIASKAFSGCTKLSTIYLGASTLCSLGGSSAFSSTRIWSTKGSIFVPASLVDAYKTATNWVFFSNRIFSYAF